ncbi:nucleotide-diphospho-sugar transferase, partial [Aureobasidium melanogenum]
MLLPDLASDHCTALPLLIDSELNMSLEFPFLARFAYCQYVADRDYLCNSLMIFESLSLSGSQADFLLIYPQHWNLDWSSIVGHWLRKARQEYGVKLAPIQLLAFNQTQYERVISLDSDANVFGVCLSYQIAVIEPSEYQFERILRAFRRRQEFDFDMKIVNDLYARDCVIIPHRTYDLITGEFRKKDHHRYLGSTAEKWDAKKILAEAKYVHFFDWPYPESWLPNSEVKRLELQPDCDGAESGERDFSERRIWNEIYREYRERQQVQNRHLFLMVVVEQKHWVHRGSRRP